MATDLNMLSTTGTQNSISTTTSNSPPTTAVSGPASASATNGTDRSSGRQSSTSGVSAGALAGAVIGTAVGVGLLTFSLTLWLARRGGKSKRPRRRRPRSTGSEDWYDRRSWMNGAAGRSRSAWENHLPQSVDDHTVKRRVKAVLDQAEVHVENNFSDARAAAADEGWEALDAVRAPQLDAPVSELISQSRRPTLLIKHVLAHLLVASDDLLLPSTMTDLPRVVDRRHDRPRSAAQALSHWRRLTAYLCPPPDADPAFQARRTSAISAAVRHFYKAFSPWLSSNASPEREANLLAIFESAAAVSLMLFAQPSVFQYDWAARPDGSVVSLPGLIKTSDENGAPLPYAQALLAPVSASSL